MNGAVYVYTCARIVVRGRVCEAKSEGSSLFNARRVRKVLPRVAIVLCEKTRDVENLPGEKHRRGGRCFFASPGSRTEMRNFSRLQSRNRALDAGLPKRVVYTRHLHLSRRLINN